MILDWVANHTSPDARWIEERPADWYVRDSLGNTIVQYDWTDIAKLDYGNADMRAAMAAAMRFWLNRGIDGFRCDMACEVPIDFWQQTLPALRKSTPASTCSPRAKPPHCTTGRSTPRMRGNCTTC